MQPIKHVLQNNPSIFSGKAVKAESIMSQTVKPLPMAASNLPETSSSSVSIARHQKRVDRRRKGIATEAAIAVRDYAFNVLDIPLLISIINHQNDASKRVAKKVGMRLMKQTNFKNVLVDVFCLKREEDISN